MHGNDYMRCADSLTQQKCPKIWESLREGEHSLPSEQDVTDSLFFAN